MVGDHFLVQGVDLSIILHIVGPAFFFCFCRGAPKNAALMVGL